MNNKVSVEISPEESKEVKERVEEIRGDLISVLDNAKISGKSLRITTEDGRGINQTKLLIEVSSRDIKNAQFMNTIDNYIKSFSKAQETAPKSAIRMLEESQISGAETELTVPNMTQSEITLRFLPDNNEVSSSSMSELQAELEVFAMEDKDKDEVKRPLKKENYLELYKTWSEKDCEEFESKQSISVSKKRFIEHVINRGTYLQIIGPTGFGRSTNLQYLQNFYSKNCNVIQLDFSHLIEPTYNEFLNGMDNLINEILNSLSEEKKIDLEKYRDFVKNSTQENILKKALSNLMKCYHGKHKDFVILVDSYDIPFLYVKELEKVVAFFKKFFVYCKQPLPKNIKVIKLVIFSTDRVSNEVFFSSTLTPALARFLEASDFFGDFGFSKSDINSWNMLINKEEVFSYCGGYKKYCYDLIKINDVIPDIKLIEKNKFYVNILNKDALEYYVISPDNNPIHNTIPKEKLIEYLGEENTAQLLSGKIEHLFSKILHITSEKYGHTEFTEVCNLSYAISFSESSNHEEILLDPENIHAQKINDLTLMAANNGQESIAENKAYQKIEKQLNNKSEKGFKAIENSQIQTYLLRNGFFARTHRNSERLVIPNKSSERFLTNLLKIKPN